MGAGMERLCESCGSPYETKRSTARFCSARCGKRGQRGHLTEAAVSPPAPSLASAPPGLVAAVSRELTEAGRLDTAVGQAALTLAVRVAAGADTGAGLASLVREMRVSLAEATAGAVRELSPLDGMRDELAARRRA